MRDHPATRAALVLVLTAGAAAQAAEKKKPPKPEARVAMIRLGGMLSERESMMSLFLTDADHGTLRGFIKRIDQAAGDTSVTAMALILDEPMLAWGQVQEIRAALARLRKAGKKVHCHLAYAGRGSYLVAAACDRVGMVPSGGLMLMGLGAEALYFKGLLDKIGVTADIMHCGAYKGAGEPFTRTGPSAESQQQMNRIFGDLYDQMLEMIAESRGLRKEVVKRIIDRGLLNAREAAAEKLIDELSYRHEFMDNLRKTYKDAELVKHYGRKKGPEIDFSSPFAFFKLLGQMMKTGDGKAKPTIAVVYVDGIITTGKSTESLFGETIVGSRTLRSVLLKAAADKNVKAVVLRVNSPGGSALASDIIHQATQMVRKTGKPLIASMGDLAASGGYYVSAGADTIFADPSTLTGSIGVVGGKVVFGGLFDWAGISTHRYTFGKNAQMFNMTRPFNEHERKVVRGMMTDTYDQFKRVVVAGRRDRLKGEIEDIAGGRIYTGRQAMKKGLVDQLGGLNEAVAFAADRAEIKDYTIRVLPKPKTLFDYINEALGIDDDNDASASVGMGGVPRTACPPAPSDAPLAWVQRNGHAMAALSLAEGASPDVARAIVRLLLRLELLRRESTLTVLPQEWIIR